MCININIHKTHKKSIYFKFILKPRVKIKTHGDQMFIFKSITMTIVLVFFSNLN